MKEETELILKSQQGDASAFGELYDFYIKKIYRFIFLKIGGNKADAEDLTHHVFFNAWKNIRSYKLQGFPFSSWLYRIAQNSIIDFWRTKKDHASIEFVSENSFAEIDKTEKLIDQSFYLEITKQGLALLSDDEQSVLIMKFVEELSNKEIAASLQKTEGAIRVIQHRALKELKKNIEKRYELQS